MQSARELLISHEANRFTSDFDLSLDGDLHFPVRCGQMASIRPPAQVIENRILSSWVMSSFQRDDVHLPALHISRYRNATVAGSGTILAADGRIAEESLWPLMPASVYSYHADRVPVAKQGKPYTAFIRGFINPAQQPGRFVPSRPFAVGEHLPGRSVSLVSRHSSNYGHWLFEVLSRLYPLDMCPEYGRADRFIVTGPQPAKYMALLELFGVEQGRTHVLPLNKAVTCDDLVVASPPNSLFDCIAPEVATFFRQRIDRIVQRLRIPKMFKDRVYFSRSGAPRLRRLLTESALEKTLRAMDYDILYPERMTLEEELSAIHYARSFVSAAGTNATGFFYLRPGAKAVFLVPPSFGASQLSTRVFCTFADVADSYVIGDLVVPMKPHAYNAAWTIDPDVVAWAVETAGNV